MNKTAIKNFAIWARNKLIADISYRAGLMGITAEGINDAVLQMHGTIGQTGFYDIGTADPYAVSGKAFEQRKYLVERIRQKERDTNYQTAYKYIIEEVAYTWFNRLIAVRFMEVNDYLPSHIRVLSSDSGKIEPDLVTTPFDADLDFTRDEQQAIIDLKNANKPDEVFRLLFIKQCNALNEILPALFEKTNDYTELLLNLSVVDQDGVVYRLVHDIPEEDFDVERGGQVEIIGWLYQYYNTEPKNAAFAKKGKITKEEVPAVTQLFTPDWIVRYMVENSLGRLWIEHLIACGDSRTEAEIASDFGWKYYLPEAEQEPEVTEQLGKIREDRKDLTPEAIRCIDPCMGSGHICVYLYSVLMQIYESAGYGQREAAKCILKNNLYGLDIDDRAFQMAYFAVMMKAREYNRRILNGENRPNMYSIQESNDIDRTQLKFFGRGMEKAEREAALQDIKELLDTFVDAKEYGSILTMKVYDWEQLERFVDDYESEGQISLESVGLEETRAELVQIIEQGRCLAQKYDVTATNPPYMNSVGMSDKLLKYVKRVYPEGRTDLYAVFIEVCIMITKKNGMLSMITQHSWMFIGSFEKLRSTISNYCMVSMVHLGARAFDEIAGEVVQTTAFVIRKKNTRNYKGAYIRALDVSGEKEKENVFIEGKTNKNNHIYFETKSRYFRKIPGNPIVYWVGENTFLAFDQTKMGELFTIRNGISTGDNDKYLRLWYEVLHNSSDWKPCNKGGTYRKWYGNNDFVVYWKNDGKDIRTSLDDKGRIKARLGGVEYSFKKGLEMSRITSGNLAFRLSSGGFIYESSTNDIYCDDDTVLFELLGYCNSKVVANHFLKMLNPTINIMPEDIRKLPYIKPINSKEIIELVERNVECAKSEWDDSETSWDFEKHPLANGSNIEIGFREWNKLCNKRFKEQKQREEEINSIYINLFSLQNELVPEIEDKDITIKKADLDREIRSLLSYAIGCMFGRYSLDVGGLAYAGGEWDSSKYTSFIPDSDNVIPLTDEEYLEDDIVARLCDWLKVVYGKETLEENLDFIAKALGNKGGSSREIIRNYFLTDFFKDHCQTYSVTGSGKRPIYWLFDSGKQNGFKALIYMHRYNADTIGNLRIDYLHRMQRIYESEIVRMQDMIDNSTNNREVAQATKRREKLTKQLKECREYDEKLAHLALSRIELDLDDGVKVNYRKLQTANEGKFYEVLADSKNIMAKK